MPGQPSRPGCRPCCWAGRGCGSATGWETCGKTKEGRKARQQLAGEERCSGFAGWAWRWQRAARLAAGCEWATRGLPGCMLSRSWQGRAAGKEHATEGRERSRRSSSRRSLSRSAPPAHFAWPASSRQPAQCRRRCDRPTSRGMCSTSCPANKRLARTLAWLHAASRHRPPVLSSTKQVVAERAQPLLRTLRLVRHKRSPAGAAAGAPVVATLCPLPTKEGEVLQDERQASRVAC